MNKLLAKLVIVLRALEGSRASEPDSFNAIERRRQIGYARVRVEGFDDQAKLCAQVRGKRSRGEAPARGFGRMRQRPSAFGLARFGKARSPYAIIPLADLGDNDTSMIDQANSRDGPII